MGRQTDAHLFQMQAEIAKILANPTRLRVLNRIGKGEVSYATLLGELGVSKTNLSQHLAILRKGGVITVRREGIHVYCRLTFPEIKDLCAAMRNILAKHLRESGRQGRLLMRRVV
ncbi:MAG TPA: metalloregulator ArsR/SmtB family transcription factor [Methylomirabilota bacterium]|nr:metalloregulator ArsR/SmtB family transcription factor [Methylomirabilota bacterium]